MLDMALSWGGERQTFIAACWNTGTGAAVAGVDGTGNVEPVTATIFVSLSGLEREHPGVLTSRK